MSGLLKRILGRDSNGVAPQSGAASLHVRSASDGDVAGLSQTAEPTADAPRPKRRIWGRQPFEDVLRDFGSFPADSDTRPRPFFIVGHPRSGTNWMSNLLNLHPQVLCTGEAHFQVLLNAMPEMVSEPHQTAFKEPAKSAVARSFQEMIRATMAATAVRKPGALRAGDHTPRLLRPMLPESEHFVIFRDGRDVVMSMTVHTLNNQSKRAGHAIPETREIFDHALGMLTSDDESLYRAARFLLTHEAWVRRFAGNWQRHVLTDLETIQRMHAGEYPGKVMSVRYEDLHARTDKLRCEMYRLLGLDPDKAAPIGTDPRTAPGYTENKTSSHYRKGKVGDWRSHFTPPAMRWFDAEAGRAMLELNYELDSAWVDSLPAGIA